MHGVVRLIGIYLGDKEGGGEISKLEESKVKRQKSSTGKGEQRRQGEVSYTEYGETKVAIDETRYSDTNTMCPVFATLTDNVIRNYQNSGNSLPKLTPNEKIKVWLVLCKSLQCPE